MRASYFSILGGFVLTGLGSVLSACGGTCDDGTVVNIWQQNGCLNGQYFKLDLIFGFEGERNCVGNCFLCDDNTYMNLARTDQTSHCHRACIACLPGTCYIFENTIQVM